MTDEPLYTREAGKRVGMQRLTHKERLRGRRKQEEWEIRKIRGDLLLLTMPSDGAGTRREAPKVASATVMPVLNVGSGKLPRRGRNDSCGRMIRQERGHRTFWERQGPIPLNLT